MVNKRILRFSNNLKEESKNNESNCYKKELNSNIIGNIYINEDNFSNYTNNYKGKYSYIPKDREENKEDSKNKSIENGLNKRFIYLSSDKYERPNRIIQNRKVKEIKRYNEVESNYNILSSDGNEYNKYNSYKKANKKNIHFGDNLEKKDINNKIFRRNHKNINRDNHRFYESNACKINYRNNNNFYSYIGYNNCKCSFLRNNSVRRNIINNNKEEGCYVSNTHKIRNFGDYYMYNNNTPRAHSNIKKENNNALSPIRRNEQNNFLYSSFIISKKNHKMLFGKSQYSYRNNTIRNINSNSYLKKANDNNCKRQIKVVNINLTESENQNNNYNNNFIMCSNPKKKR